MSVAKARINRGISTRTLVEVCEPPSQILTNALFLGPGAGNFDASKRGIKKSQFPRQKHLQIPEVVKISSAMGGREA